MIKNISFVFNFLGTTAEEVELVISLSEVW